MSSKSKNLRRGTLVSLIVLNYNGLRYMGAGPLKECLDSIIGCNYPCLEVIFVDNGSDDGSSVFVAKAYGDKVLVIKNESNRGCGEGFNAGFEVSKGDYVVTIPNDLVVERNWLEPIVNLMESDSRVAITGPKRLRYGTSRVIDAIGGDLSLSGRLFPIGAGEVDRGQYDSNIDDLDFIGIQIIRRKVIDQVGLFDPGYSPFFAEDLDLCFRVRKAGYRIVYVFDAVVWHRGGSTFKGLSRREGSPAFITYMTERNRIRTNLIHFLIRRIFAAFLIDFIWFVVEPNCTTKRMLLKAYLWNLKNVAITLRRRREIGPSPPYGCKYGQHLSSLRDPLARLLRLQRRRL
jgi:hypothetical protein